MAGTFIWARTASWGWGLVIWVLIRFLGIIGIWLWRRWRCLSLAISFSLLLFEPTFSLLIPRIIAFHVNIPIFADWSLLIDNDSLIDIILAFTHQSILIGVEIKRIYADSPIGVEGGFKWLQGRTHHVISRRGPKVIGDSPLAVLHHALVRIYHLRPTCMLHPWVVYCVLRIRYSRLRHSSLQVDMSIGRVKLLQLSLYLRIKSRMINEVGNLLGY